MKVLVLGCGAIGLQRIQAFASHSQVSEILAYDPVPRGSLPAKTRFLTEPDAFQAQADAAVIATPHDVACRSIQRLAKNSPFILVEKPLGRTYTEAEQMIQAGREHGSRIFVGFNYRFLKNIQHLKTLIGSDRLGNFLGADCILAHGAAPGYEKSWKTSRERCGGGVCIDPGVHVFDLLNWLVGPIELSSGILSRTFWPIDVEDHAHLQFTNRSGAIAQISLSISSWKSRFEMTLEFENAQILIRGRGKFYGDQKITIVSKWPWTTPAEARETELNFGTEDPSFKEETDDFVAIAAGKRTSSDLATGEQSLHVMKLVDACYQLPRSWEKAL